MVAVPAPICVGCLRSQSDAIVRTADLVKTSNWERRAVIEKGGYGTIPTVSRRILMSPAPLPDLATPAAAG